MAPQQRIDALIIRLEQGVCIENSADFDQFVAACVDEAIDSPQHSRIYASAFASLNKSMKSGKDGSPLSLRQQLLDEIQGRVEDFMSPEDGAWENDCAREEEFLALARLLGAMLLEKMVAFNVVSTCIESWLYGDGDDEELQAEVFLEAAALMTLAISPIFQTYPYGNDGRALEMLVEDRFKEILELQKTGSVQYSSRVTSLVESVVHLIEVGWDQPGPTRVVQCVLVHDQCGDRMQFVSMTGEVYAQVPTQELTDVATARRSLSKILAVAEHQISLISPTGSLLNAGDDVVP